MAKKEEIIVLDLSVNIGDTRAKLAVLTGDLIKLKEANAQLTKEAKAAFAAGDDATFKKKQELISANNTAIKNLTREQSQYQSTMTKVSQVNKAAEGSYEQLLREYELASVALKTQEGLIVRNKDGSITLTEAYKQQAEKVKVAKDAIDTFNKGIGDGRSSVGQYAAAMREAFADTGLFANQTKVLQDAFKVAKGGTDLFKNGLKGLGAAFATTGLPLFVNSLNFLVGLFQRNEAASEGFARVMSAIGAVINALVGTFISFGKQVVAAIKEPQKVLTAVGDYIDGTLILAVKSLGNILKGIFTLDFDSLSDGVKGIGDAFTNQFTPIKNAIQGVKDFGAGMKQTASDAAALTGRMQQLEDKEREFQVQSETTKLKVDELIKSARERAGSEEERVRLLDEAAKLETDLLNTEKQLAQERFDILTAQNALLEKQGQLKDTDRQAAVDAQTTIVRLEGESAIKSQEISNRKTLLLNAANKLEIQNRIDTLNSRLAIEEANGRDTIALRRKIAEEEKNILLEDAKDNKLKQEQIELDYTAKLINIERDAREKRKAIIEQAQDIELTFIKDANVREIAELELNHSRKIATIKGNTQEEITLRETLENELAFKLSEIRSRIESETSAEAAARIEQSSDSEISLLNRKYDDIENGLRESLSRRALLDSQQFGDTGEAANQARLQREQQFTTDMLALRLRRAQEELNIITQFEAQKQFQIEKSYLNEFAAQQKLFDEGVISRETFGVNTAEIDKRYNKLREEQQTASGEVIKEKEQEVKSVQTEIVITGNEQILEAERAAAAQREQIEQKTLAVIGQGFDTFAKILSKDEASKKKNADLLKTLASAQILLNLYAEISGYWKGVGVDAGTTGNLYTTGASAAIAAASTAFAITRAALAIGEVTSTKPYFAGGFTGSGTGVQDGTGHTVAGVVHNDEWVAPKWMVKNPVFAPVFGTLESLRRNKKSLPFADGGFASQFVSSQILQVEPQQLQIESTEAILKRVQIVASAEEISGMQTLSAQIQQNAEI
jgi:hypothetical protein